RPPPRFNGLIDENLVSQKRSTCCGTSRSVATSLMVRNASGDLTMRPLLRGRRVSGSGLVRERRVDLVLEDMRGTKNEDTPGLDRHFLTRLRIAADAPALVPHGKGAERGQLHGLSAHETDRDLVENALDKLGGF